MVYTDRQDELDRFMNTFVPEKRLKHCSAVSKMAEKLALIYGADPEKASFAGMYHDIAKAYPVEISNRLLRDYDLSDAYYNNRALAHSKLGAAMLEIDYHVNDADILSAVRKHTTGSGDMSLLDVIIFVADAVDETRDYNDVSYYRDLACNDLYRACYEILEFNIRSVQEKGRVLDPDTLAAMEFIRRINESNI